MAISLRSFRRSISGCHVRHFHEFRTLQECVNTAEPQVHLLRGFSSFLPAPDVIETLTERAKLRTNLPSFIPQFQPERFSVDSPNLAPKVFIQERAFSSLLEHSIPAPQDAFFVLDLDAVRAKQQLWARELPSVKPYYAVKSNPNPEIIRCMMERNLGFDCASTAEIAAVLQAGASPSDIIFANPCKSLAHIDFARQARVARTTFDSEAELYKIKMVYPEAEVILRIWVDDKDAQCQLSNKYGAHVDEAKGLLHLAKLLGLDVAGVSFHAGSGSTHQTYVGALEDAYTVFQEGLALGLNLRVLDIGGGFPGTETAECSLRQVAAGIRPILDSKWQGVELIAEPGRFFCSESQTLGAQVIGKRVRGSKREYTINDGMYQSFNCLLYDHSVLLDDVSRTIMPLDMHASTVFGHTCDGLDTIGKQVCLPELRIGDWLAFPAMGAYTNGASSTFNGFPLNTSIAIN